MKICDKSSGTVSESTNLIYNNMSKKIPLVIDLDGTLILTDTLHELVLALLKKNVFLVFYFPLLLLQGKANFKRYVSTKIEIDVTALPYNYEFIAWIKKQRLAGRKLILCTGADNMIARKVAEHLNIFSEIYSSDGDINLIGSEKSKFLVNKFGLKGFDYAGNSFADIYVWRASRKGVLVNTSRRLSCLANGSCELEAKFSCRHSTFSEFLRSLRLHQWLKNFLLFVPFLASHQALSPHYFWMLFLSYLSFGMCASSVYIFNDLADLESDRKHPRKSKRPFAAGSISITTGLVAASILVFVGAVLGSLVSGNFLYWLYFYFFLTCAYTYLLKKIIIIDCLTLAMLYTIRVISGTVAIQIPISYWLLAFSVFLFLSLAFVKRYTELNSLSLSLGEKVHGRGYYQSDLPLIQSMGITSAYASVLVFALYLNSDSVLRLYKSPEFVWGAVPILLFWVSWMWINAFRGKMHDDPLIFAVKDRISQVSCLAFLLVVFVGSIGFMP